MENIQTIATSIRNLSETLNSGSLIYRPFIIMIIPISFILLLLHNFGYIAEETIYTLLWPFFPILYGIGFIIKYNIQKNGELH